MPLPATFTSSQLELVRRTMARDCNDAEFDLFIENARALGLSPLRRQIFPIVFSKNSPDRRQMVLVTSIEGLRDIAARHGDYRPDEDEPTFHYSDDLKSETNPLGIERAVVRCYKRDPGGEWRRISGVAYWDEFAPIETSRETGKPTLDPSKVGDKSFWRRMPRHMLAKCAEAVALRKGWPSYIVGVFAEEEVDKAKTLDLTATEIIEEDHKERRRTLTGGPGYLFMFDFETGLENVPKGEVIDRLMACIRECDSGPELRGFWETNRAAFGQVWADMKADALEVKKAMESKLKELGWEPPEKTGTRAAE